MSYSRTWNEGTPAGTAAANTIDTIIQQMKVDFRERMDGSFSEDWSADPVIPKAEISGKRTNKILIIGADAFVSEDANTGALRKFQTYAQIVNVSSSGSAPQFCYARIDLPPGVRIQALVAAVDKGGNTSNSMQIYRVSQAGVLDTVGGASVKNTAGVGYSAVVTGFNQLVGEDEAYYVRWFTSGNINQTSRMYFTKIGYDSPDSRYTR